MIKIETQVVFENYNKLFAFICEMDCKVEDGNLFESYFQLKDSNWSFVRYSPERVAALCQFGPVKDPGLWEAYEGHYGVLEICTGAYTKPQYIAITPTIDMDELKKKWCQGYCQAHGLAVAETDSQSPKPLAETKSVLPSVNTVKRANKGSLS